MKCRLLQITRLGVALLLISLLASTAPAPSVVAARTGGRAAASRLVLLQRFKVGFPSDDLAVLAAPPILLVAQEAGKRALVLDERSGQLLARIALPTGARHVAVDPALKQIYLPDEFSGQLAVVHYTAGWRLLTTTLVRVGRQPHGVAIEARSHRVYVGNEHGNTVSIIDGHSLGVLATVPVGRVPGGVASTAGLIYVVLVRDNGVAVLNTDGTVLHTIAVGKGPTHLALDTATGRAAVVNTTANTLSIVDGAQGLALPPVPVVPRPYSVAIDGARGLIFVASSTTPALSILDSSQLTLRATVKLDLIPGSLTVDTVRRLLIVGGNSRSTLEIFSYSSL